MCHLLLAFCENDQSVRCQITSVLMETQCFERNKDGDLFGILKLPYYIEYYWFIPRINSSMVLGSIEGF